MPLPRPQPPVTGPVASEEPVAASVRIQFPFGIPYCGALILMVPRGKRLVIDSISFEGKARAGQGFLRATTTFEGHAMTYIVPALGLHLTGAPEMVAGSASLRLYADPGTLVMVTFHSGVGGHCYGINSIRASLSGHYVFNRQYT